MNDSLKKREPEKPMCWIRDEWSWERLYAIYKCRHESFAVCQLKGVEAPRCLNRCAGCAEINAVLVIVIAAIVAWAVIFIYKIHSVMWRFIH